jgi:hypothetical protein
MNGAEDFRFELAYRLLEWVGNRQSRCPCNPLRNCKLANDSPLDNQRSERKFPDKDQHTSG